MLIDVWRVLVVYRYGGIYTDIDNWPGPNLNEGTIGPDEEGFFLSTLLEKPSQWFFAMEPRHPMLYNVMMQILARLLDMNQVEKPHLVTVTGPIAFESGHICFTEGRMDRSCIKCEGSHNKTLRRIPHKESGDLVQGSLNGTMNEKKEWNDGAVISRRKRILNELGIRHWQQAVRGRWNHQGATGSCMAHLYSLDM